MGNAHGDLKPESTECHWLEVVRNRLGAAKSELPVGQAGKYTQPMISQRIGGVTVVLLRLLLLSVMMSPQTLGFTVNNPTTHMQPASQKPIRATADRPDDVDGYQIHIMYTIPSDGIDRERDLTGQIETSLMAVQKWFREETGGTGLRLDTFQGKPDITFVRLAQTDAEMSAAGAFMRDRLEAELVARGFADSRKLYAVYHDGGNNFTCGGGAGPPQLVGWVALMVLRGTPPGSPPCANNPFGESPSRPVYRDFVMMHEVIHSLGAVASCAPHATTDGKHHTADHPGDIMYGGTLPASFSRRLDPGRDDYYGHGRPDCFDLAKSAFLDPLPANAAPPPGWPPVAVPDLGCAQEGSVRSASGSPTKLRVENIRREPVNVFWVDRNGQQVPSGTIQPFSRMNMNPYATDVFVIKSQAGACLGIFRAIGLPAGIAVGVVR